MSLQFRIQDQVLQVDDFSDATEALVYKYSAFLNLLCSDRYTFQRDCIQSAWRFLISPKYPDLERLARENWNDSEAIRQRHDELNLYLEKMPLRAKKAVSLDLATGTGKSYVMYGLAAMALAEGMVDRVLVLCPSLTIEEGLLDKFRALAGNPELAAIMNELGSAVPIPNIKQASDPVFNGDICVENIHAVYERTGSSIKDSFKGYGARTLVLNDEAHHLFSPPDTTMRQWLQFLLNEEFGFQYIVSVTGTPYVENEYFPDIVSRFGLKDAIAAGVVKKPDYKIEDTLEAHDWQKTYAFHEKNRKTYAGCLRPISIVVTHDIARCVEVWRELVDFLVEKEGINPEEAEEKAIWVASGIPSAAAQKARVAAAYGARDANDSPEKRRKENLLALKSVDEASSPVEWIVSVSMLTEGWDVKNVFQIVPHESRAFSSKLLIAQVLGRGLRVPPGLSSQPLVTINNHEAWSGEIGDLLKEILEVEYALTWGYDPARSQFLFPLHNLSYEFQQTSVEVKRRAATESKVTFEPQQRVTNEVSTFSETGSITVAIEHKDIYEIENAVSLIRLFLREKSDRLAAKWTKKKIRELIVSGLEEAGYESDFLSKANFLRVQQAFSGLLQELGREHPRFGQVAQDLISVDLSSVNRQSFIESRLKEHGMLFYVPDGAAPFSGHEQLLFERYLRAKQIAETDDETMLSDDLQQIAKSLQPVEEKRFKCPWNVLYASHEPEREFCTLLFHFAGLFEAFVKMPDQGLYSFPYSYKPSRTGKTHTVNDTFNPDFFLKVADSNDILVVEIKADGDDSNRNRAKLRDGREHFKRLNERLEEAGEPWRYHFLFLSPENYSQFFDQVRDKNLGWQSGLMQELTKG